MEPNKELNIKFSPEQPKSSSDSQPTVQDLNRLLMLQRNQLEKITQHRPLKEVLRDLCSEIEEIVGNCFVSVSVLDKQKEFLNLLCAPKVAREFRPLLSKLQPSATARSCGAAVFDNQPIFTINTHTDPRWADSKSLTEILNIGSCWSYPLHESATITVGSISIFSPTPRVPSTFHARLLESAAHLASIVISNHHHRVSLRDSEQRFEHIASSIPGVVLQTEFPLDASPYFTFVSEGIKALCGLNAVDVLADFNLFWKRIYHKDKSNIEAYSLRTPENGALWNIECRIIDGQGNIKWVHIASTPEWSKDNRLIRLNSILLDITREKEAYAQLELAGIAFASTNEGIMVSDPNNIIIDVNRAYCEMTGYARDELIGKLPSLLYSNFHEQFAFEEIQKAIHEHGLWQGEVWNRRKNGEPYPQWLNVNAVYNDQGDLTHYVSVAADVSKIKESEAKVRHMSQHDALTDLPNRQLFKRLLDHTIEHIAADENVAVLMVDLDRFKHVNETMGHQIGDQLLLQVTERLRNTIDENCLLARVGGDEFAIMVEHCANQGDAERTALQIVQQLENPFDLDGHRFFTTASIGVTLYPQHGFDSETLIKNADTAVHRAKDRGRNNYAFYRPEQTEVIEQWVRLEPELRKALKLNQFKVYYQPQIDASTGRISGVEALIRWQHPTEGMMSPALFLPIVEEIGLMTPVGNWVLEEACKQAIRWQTAGYPEFRIAVNIDGQQILSKGFVEFVGATLKRHGLKPDLLELEIVENIVVKHADAARPVLAQLRELGVRLALDDFGTGYSSLSYLKMLPVQKVKIDQSLVRDIPSDPNDEAIARAVIALSHSLNLTVCAEGVETQEQKVFLRRENCDQLQGYLINRPIPADQLSDWLDQQAILLNDHIF